jgi:hypothetical protein
MGFRYNARAHDDDDAHAPQWLVSLQASSVIDTQAVDSIAEVTSRTGGRRRGHGLPACVSTVVAKQTKAHRRA